MDKPTSDCALCPRLAEYRCQLRAENPDWFNAPVPGFGNLGAQLLIVGLAPGVSGANRTGRPFTGDFAGEILYGALARYGWSNARFDAHLDDGLELKNCRIINAVRCVPPQNKPIGAEINSCRRFLAAELNHHPSPRQILVLGQIAHNSVLRSLGLKLKNFPFIHGAVYNIENGQKIYSSYHCSRYNINTGRLTTAMFDRIFETITAQSRS